MNNSVFAANINILQSQSIKWLIGKPIEEKIN